MAQWRWSRRIGWGLAVILAAAVGCSDDPEIGNNDNQNQRDEFFGEETHFRCDEGPPEDADPPPPLKDYSGGQCPQIQPGFNTIESSGYEREFKLVVPENLDDDETLPVIFMWHWLAGDAEGFVDRGQIQKAVDTQRFLAVVPESAEHGDELQWPFTTAHSDDHFQEELVFFDDMLTCVAESFDVERNCVSSAGISAGGLWTSQLISHRSEYLGSFVSLAGGVHAGEPGDILRPWESAERNVPGIVLWGGPDDICLLIDFEESSRIFQRHLEEDGHFFLECVHNCGHTKPPTEPEEGEAIMSGFWEFAFDHPLWVKEGSSPYTHEGLPESMPEWCAVGKDNAQIREGDCEPDEC